MTGWRFYAQRAVSGEWLANDFELDGDVTESLSGPGSFKARIPAGLDVHLADDGEPLWLERSTKLYGELDNQLRWVGVCDYTAAGPKGRDVEFVGLSGALAWMPYDGMFTAWRPLPLEVVTDMILTVQARPNGNLGLTVSGANGIAPGPFGDPEPPPRPVQPPQAPGESDEDYDDRLLPWEEAVDAWEKLYGNRAPYVLAAYTAPMVGAELDRLAKSAPFDYRIRHRWIDRNALTAEHVLELGTHIGGRRQDLAFVDGVNLSRPITPETDQSDYANDVIVLGSGEGTGMLRGRASTLDGRLWSAKVVNAKDITDETRLRALAADELARSRMSTKLADADVWDTSGYAPVATLSVGDEVWVESAFTTPPFAAWCPVKGISRNTRQPHRAKLTFDTGQVA